MSWLVFKFITRRDAIKKLIVSTMLAASIHLGGQVCRAATYYVTTNGLDFNSGTSWALALATISNGVDKAVTPGDTVLVSNGTYMLSTNIYITNGITLRGFNGRDVTVINANRSVSNRCVFISHSNAVVERFTLTDGNMPSNTFPNLGQGGGAFINYGTLSDCIVVSNVATSGGGVLCNTNGMVTNCVICYNTTFGVAVSSGGGGLALCESEAHNCFIFGNLATSVVSVGYGQGGGAVFYSGGILANCTVSNNYSCHDGGGIYIFKGTRNAISNCLIAGNACGVIRYGGGIYLNQCTATFTDTVISNNYGVSHALLGGGVLSAGAISAFYNCTIVTNWAQIGGGICLAQNSSMLLTNCVISNNYRFWNSGTGGGIDAGSYSPNSITAVWCRIVNNIAKNNLDKGAGIYVRNNYMFDHCVIQENSGANSYGAAVYIRSDGQGAIRNCLIGNNTAKYGAGIYIEPNATSCVSSCTIAGNYATANGGGIYMTNNGSDTFTNCVIASNTAIADSDLYLPTSERSNSFWYSCASTLPATQGNITNAPVFAGASTNNWRLAKDSPGRSAGTIEDWMQGNTDLDGRPRIWRGFGRVDMGAYECERKGVVFSLH
ncbi:MAG: right-handed parallel beta-helix repeat-containing protein [Kiritimatiellae bacterium]|nr:right-handed parallel beta-helix repeat-containing protein [Kiritimatiellia bacterium]